MQNFSYIAAALIVLLAAPARGEQNSPSSEFIAKATKKPAPTNSRKTDSGKRIVDRPQEVVYADSSEAHRQGKKGSVVAELIGFAPLPGLGIAGGYYLKADDLLEVSYHTAEVDVGFVEVRSNLTEVRLKHWFGNSFYLNSGIAYRTVAGKATLAPLTGNDNISSSISASSLGVAFAIGNRWQWDTFSIGCDWIGTFLPLVKTESKVSDSSGASPSKIEEAKKDTDDLALTNSGMLLRFYLGASF